MSKLKIRSQADSWRLRCPNGHQVAPTNNHWYCRACAAHWDPAVNSEYEYAIDARTGEKLAREDVDLDPDTPGVYHA